MDRWVKIRLNNGPRFIGLTAFFPFFPLPTIASRDRGCYRCTKEKIPGQGSAVERRTKVSP